MGRLWTGMLWARCLVSIALVSACDDEAATPVVGPEITPTYTPFPTATVSSTPSPTPTPTVTPTLEPNSLQSMNGGRQSDASDDKVRILALQGKGGSFSVLPCTTYNFKTGEKETCDQEQWQMVQDADIVRWEDCAFGRHGLGGFVSHVTIVLDDESWHTVYAYDKNVC